MRLLVIVVSVVLLVGCGGEDTSVEKAEEEPGVQEVEETSVKATSKDTGEAALTQEAPPRSSEEAAEQGKSGAKNTISIDPNSPVPPAEQVEYFRMLCQAYKASGENLETFEETFDAYFQEAMNSGRTVAELLSERGYECTNQEVREFQRLGQ
jgi:hypothetical protein